MVTGFNAMAGRLDEVEATRRRLLADPGHELRTPVATIEAYVDAAEDGVLVADEDTWTVLRAQTGRLRRLAEDVAAVSRAEEQQLDLHRRRVPVADLVGAAVAAARPRCAGRGIELRQRVAADLPDVEADPERIGQVLANLLDNALRHTPAGGIVTAAAADPDGVRIAVVDTGEGIPRPRACRTSSNASTAPTSATGPGVAPASAWPSRVPSWSPTEAGSPPTAAGPTPAPPSS